MVVLVYNYGFSSFSSQDLLSANDFAKIKPLLSWIIVKRKIELRPEGEATAYDQRLEKT